MATPFFSDDWAQAAMKAVNAGPDAEARAEKIDRFWEWIDDAKEKVNCQLGLAVRNLPGEKPDCLLLDLEQGVCTQVQLASFEEAEQSATYLLAGNLEDWREIMDGFDMGRAVMYRKLMLEKGSVLEFFRSAYYWTESLACIQRSPTDFPTGNAAPN